MPPLLNRPAWLFNQHGAIPAWCVTDVWWRLSLLQCDPAQGAEARSWQQQQQPSAQRARHAEACAQCAGQGLPGASHLGEQEDGEGAMETDEEEEDSEEEMVQEGSEGSMEADGEEEEQSSSQEDGEEESSSQEDDEEESSSQEEDGDGGSSSQEEEEQEEEAAARQMAPQPCLDVRTTPTIQAALAAAQAHAGRIWGASSVQTKNGVRWQIGVRGLHSSVPGRRGGGDLFCRSQAGMHSKERGKQRCGLLTNNV